MATVLAEVTTRQQVFPLGTVEGLNRFELTTLTGFVLSFVETASLGASFPQVPPGDYIVKVTKNGVSAQTQFTVPRTEEVFAVPATITVTLS